MGKIRTYINLNVAMLVMLILSGIIIGNKTVSASENIVLQMDMVGNRALTITKDTVLDLRGHDAEVYVESGYVEIKDTLGMGRLIGENGGYNEWDDYGLIVRENATVVVENAEIAHAKSYGTLSLISAARSGAIELATGSSTSISGGNYGDICGEKDADISIVGGTIKSVDTWGAIEMYGGTITSYAEITGKTFRMYNGTISNASIVCNSDAKFIMDNGTLNNSALQVAGEFIMNGGKITTSKSNGVMLDGKNPKVTINNGTIDAKNYGVFAHRLYGYSYDEIVNNITINNGTFKGDYIFIANTLGDFTESPKKSDFLPVDGLSEHYDKGYVANINIKGGKFSIYSHGTYSNGIYSDYYQYFIIDGNMNCNITGGEFDTPVDIKSKKDITMSNVKMNKGLTISSKSEVSPISVNLNKCTVKGDMEVSDSLSKGINMTISGGTYEKIDFSGRDKGKVVINSGTFLKDVDVDAQSIIINNGNYKGNVHFDAESLAINGGTYDKKVDVFNNYKGKIVIKSGNYKDRVSISAASVTINGGNYKGQVYIAAVSATINGGNIYNKKDTALYVVVKSSKNIKLNGGTFKTGKKNKEALKISYTDKKKAKINSKKIKSILKKGYSFGKGYVKTENSGTSKNIYVYGSVNIKKGKIINWAVEFQTPKTKTYKLPNGRKVNGEVYSVVSIKSVKNGGKYGKLPKVKRKGYVFKGWYTKISGGKKVTKRKKYKLKNSSCLYARFVKKK